MNQEPQSHDNRDLIILVLLLGLGIAGFQLGMTATGHDISRDQHLATAIEFARGHINLLRPVIVGFNANGAPTPLEFPIWQALVALPMKVFGIWYGWGNIVALFFLFSILWPVFQLARGLFSERIAWWTIFFFLTQPLNIVIGGAGGADGTAWAFAVWFVYLASRMMDGGGWAWWPAAVAFGSLSATTKAPFFMSAGLTTFFWLLARHRTNRAAWFQLASAGGVSCLIFLAWNIHAQHCYDEAEFPLVNLSILRGSQIRGWYFGDLAYRLKLSNWIHVIWRMVGQLMANPGMVFLLAGCLRLPKTLFLWLWLMAGGFVSLVFTPLIMEHMHYFFIFSPAVAILCARAWGEIEYGIWQKLGVSAMGRTLLVFTAAAVSLAATLRSNHLNQFLDGYATEVAQTLKQHTAPTDKLVVWGMVWSEPFMRAERSGLTGGFSLGDTAWLSDPQKLTRLKELGYTKLVFINGSPFLIALTTATGTHLVISQKLSQFVPAVAKDWPVSYASESLLIIDVPQ